MPARFLDPPPPADLLARNVLAQIQNNHGDLPLSALIFLLNYGSANREAFAILAHALDKSGFSRAALEAWDRALRHRPHNPGWIGAALNCLWRKENAGDLFAKWTSLLDKIYISPPDIALLEELARRGHESRGSVGIQDGRLRGWLWLPQGQSILQRPLAGTPALPVNLRPSQAGNGKILYQIDQELPQTLAFFELLFTDGQPVPGSPLLCWPPKLINAANANLQSATTIIIPVYDDKKATLSCLGSIFASQKANKSKARILAVWDHGPDQSLVLALDRLARKGKIDLLQAPANMGFLGAVNWGIAHAPGGDVILLNADTLVHGDWLDRMEAIAAREDAATVTALGNEAELLSFPSPQNRARVRTLRQTAILDEAAASLPETLRCCPIPVGVGFCMLITRRALNAIGGLDGRMVCRGYSEEVDYCLRAQKAGLTNYAALNVFVAHLGGRSFGPAKITLAAQNNAAIFKNYPDYELDYEKFCKANPVRPAADLISRRACARLRRPPLLHVLPWSAQKLPPWQGDRPLAALFLLPMSEASGRACLRIHGEFALADMLFDLPAEQAELESLLKTLSFGDCRHYGLPPRALCLARGLGLDPSWQMRPRLLLPRAGKLSGRLLAAPPANAGELAALRKYALANPEAQIYVHGLRDIWPGLTLPPNLDWLPDFEDLRPLAPAGMLFAAPPAPEDDWPGWLEKHFLCNLPLYSLEDA